MFIICDKNKIGDKNIVGAPDLVIEVLSPSTVRNDRWIKFNSYEKAGVKEYWIVDPYNMSVEVYILDGEYFQQTEVLGKEDVLTAGILPELQIELTNIFKE